MAEWFYKVNDEVRGPVSRQELESLVQLRRLPETAEVRVGKDGVWKKLNSRTAVRRKGEDSVQKQQDDSVATSDPVAAPAHSPASGPPPLALMPNRGKLDPTRRQVAIGVMLSTALLLLVIWMFQANRDPSGSIADSNGSELAQSQTQPETQNSGAAEKSATSDTGIESTTSPVGSDAQTPADAPGTSAADTSTGSPENGADATDSGASSSTEQRGSNASTMSKPTGDGAVSSEPPSDEEGIFNSGESRTAGDPLSRFTISAPGEATFFGLSATGHRFAFVVDRSGSMSGPPLERAKEELLKCLKHLPPGTEVLVIFYDNFASPDPAGYRRISPGQLKVLASWINNQAVGGGTDAEVGLRQAFADKQKPDAVFLLTDGAIDSSTARAARELNPDGKVRINTIALISREGEPILQQIAKENQGDYRFVP